MSAKSNISDDITKLERKLAKIEAAERKQLINENILYLEKNGDIGYETVRTYKTPAADPVNHRDHAATDSAANFYTEPPVAQENGQLFGDSATSSLSQIDPTQPTQVLDEARLNDMQSQALPTERSPSSSRISIHDDQTSGQQIALSKSGLPSRTSESPSDSDVQIPLDRQNHQTDESADPLEDLLARALSRPRRGRPASFDDHNKGKLVALLSLGMSLRQAAAVLGVSHGTIHNTLKADPALAEEITAARFQAQLQPLACVIREARRSWKAATWLLKYLDNKVATHEETPDERRQRQAREAEEFFARSPVPNVKTHKTLG